jgi:hypothetical protein
LIEHQDPAIRIQALSSLKAAFNRFVQHKKPLKYRQIMLIKGLFTNNPKYLSGSEIEEEKDCKKSQERLVSALNNMSAFRSNKHESSKLLH